MPTTDTAALALFSNPDLVNKVVDSYNKQNPKHQMSVQDKGTLKKDHALAEAVFNGGLKDLVAAGKTNVAQLEKELKEKPEVIDFLRHHSTQAAVKDGVITVDQLAHTAPEKLKAAEAAIGHGNLAEAGKDLGLDDKQTKVFMASVERQEVTDKAAHSPAKPANTPAQTRALEIARQV